MVVVVGVATVVVTTVAVGVETTVPIAVLLRGGNDDGNRGVINGGSIINAPGQYMKFPAALSKQYYGHFIDTELR